MDVRLSLAGLVVGFFVGLSGVGGSAILAPLLILVLGVKPALVIGTDLLYSVPTKLLAVWLHKRQGTIDWRIARLLLFGGVPGAMAGIVLFATLRARLPLEVFEASLKHGIGIAILIASAGTLLLAFRRATPSPDANFAIDHPAGVVAIGSLVGLLVALTSVGSGSVTLPLLMLALPAITLRRVIGSEIAFSAFLVPLAAVGQGALGNVNWAMAVSLLIGSLPGVWLGARLVRVLGDVWLRPTIVVVLAVAGSRLL